MRYSILGFNQEKAVSYGLSLKDLLLLQYIGDALASRRMKHTEDEDGNPYVWLQHNKIQQDLPILDIKERELNYSLNKLKELGLIQSKDVRESGVRGSRIYYALTELADSLKYSDDVEETLPAKNCTQSEVLPAKNCTPDNLLNNNILNSNFTNVKLEQPAVTRKPLIKPECANDVATPTSNKKKSLYEKCADYIDEYTDDERLRKNLIEYLKFRLAVKEKPIYLPQWRTLVNSLNDLANDVETKIKIVQQSIINGWCKFVELKTYNKHRGGQDKSVFSEYGQVKSVHKEETIVNVQF